MNNDLLHDLSLEEAQAHMFGFLSQPIQKSPVLKSFPPPWELGTTVEPMRASSIAAAQADAHAVLRRFCITVIQGFCVSILCELMRDLQLEDVGFEDLCKGRRERP